MEEGLPSSVDVIVMGTGMGEALYASASARAGLSLLHLDSSPYYGSEWASFTLSNIDDWKNEEDGGESEESNEMKEEGEYVIYPIRKKRRVSNIEDYWTDESERYKNEEQGIRWREDIESYGRRFNIDITPKILLSRGLLVQFLCDAQASKYAEFKLVDRLLACNGDKIYRVPCSRSEIFATEALSAVDKRRLMKFLTYCVEWIENKEGMEDWKVGRFGSSPFLCPLYGSGDLPQCFARLSAVFGGIYYIGRRIEGIKVRNNRVESVLIEGDKEIKTEDIALSSSFLPSQLIRERKETKKIFRAILITNGSICKEEKEHISLLNLACVDPLLYNSRLYEVGFEGCVAPRGYYVVHLTAPLCNESNGLIQKVIDKFYSSQDGPRVLRVIHFHIETDDMNIDLNDQSVLQRNLPTNLTVIPLPDSTVNYESIVEKVKEYFGKSHPDVDFLPKSLITGESDNTQEDKAEISEENATVEQNEE